MIKTDNPDQLQLAGTRFGQLDRRQLFARRVKGMSIVKLVPLILALGVLGPALSTAQNLSFLKDAPASYFNEKDNEMMMQTADAVLNDESIDAAREWKNPDTGNSGKAEVVKVYKDSAGIPCKRVRFTNLVHNGVTGKSAFTLCKKSDTWTIMSRPSK